MRLKHLAKLVTGRVGREPRALLTLDLVESGTGRLLASPQEDLPADAGVGDALPGDVLFAKLRPYLAKVWLVDRRAYTSPELMCLRPAPHVDPRWLSYVMLATTTVDFAVATSDGTKMPRTSWARLREMEVTVRSISAQKSIADFLDAETARIDALIERKLELIKLLEERRWALLASEIAAAAAPMAPLRRALFSITDGPFGSTFASSDYSEDGVAVVRLGNIGFAEWRGETLAHLPVHRFKEFRRYSVSEGDLLFAGLGDVNNHAGRACVAPDLGAAIVKGKCFCGRVDRSVAIPEYLAVFCSSSLGADAIAVEARGSTRSMINLDILKAVPVPLPDVPTQQAIVDKVNSARKNARAVERRLAVQIALLREHRQVLITAALSSELEIPGGAA